MNNLIFQISLIHVVDCIAQVVVGKRVTVVEVVFQPMEILFMESAPLQNVVKRKKLSIAENVVIYHASC